MLVRPVQREDVVPLVEIGKVMHKESVYAHLDYDIEKLHQLGEGIAANPDSDWAAFTAIAATGERIGMLVGYIAEHTFGRDKVAQDFINFVLPERRGIMAGKAMIHMFEDWAKRKGVAEVYLGITTGVEVERTAKLYERLGYERAGILFKKRV